MWLQVSQQLSKEKIVKRKCEARFGVAGTLVLVCCIWSFPGVAATNEPPSCIAKQKVGTLSIRADETNWKLFGRFGYVNFVSIFENSISMITHPKLSELRLLRVTQADRVIAENPAHRFTYLVRKVATSNSNQPIPVKKWFEPEGVIEVVLGRKIPRADSNELFTSIKFDASNLHSAIKIAESLRADLAKQHASGRCAIDQFQRVEMEGS